MRGHDDGATEERNPASFYDPEIVVIASNPVGGSGIGVGPHAYVLGMDVQCTPVEDLACR